MACFKGPKTQFGKIPTRIPSQPLFCLLMPRSQRSATGHGWDRFASLHSMSVSGLVGGGRRRRRMGRGWGCKRAAEPPLRDPRLRSRSGSQASSQDPRTSASARAQSFLGAACPAPRRLVLALRTPCSRPGRSSLRASYLAPPDSPAQRAPHLGHSTSFEHCVWAPRLLCTPCQKKPTPRIPAPRTPHV